jgi:hypothetical protein
MNQYKTKDPANAGSFRGVGRDRTADTRIFSPLLYRLSYRTILLLAEGCKYKIFGETSEIRPKILFQWPFISFTSCPAPKPLPYSISSESQPWKRASKPLPAGVPCSAGHACSQYWQARLPYGWSGAQAGWPSAQPLSYSSPSSYSSS